MAVATHVPFMQRHVARWFAPGRALGERLARWETAAMRDEIAATPVRAPVWICGMARAGSTVLLEMLDRTRPFTAHRYSDYPMLWTPYWWNRLRARLPLPRATPQERAHRDRLAVTVDSPEAFEEVFWMHHFPHRHDAEVSQVLDAATSNPRFDAFLDAHIRKLLLVRGASRYLAKANYHLPRLDYLIARHPDARFVIPLREPVAQVASLLKQDALFRRLDAEDPAVSAHLARIGHYEFGPHKRALNVGDAELTRTITACYANGRTAEGYAHQWVAQYGHALARTTADPALARACLWVSFERLCGEPEPQLRRIAAHVGLDADATDALVRDGCSRLSLPDYYAPPLADDEREVVARITRPLWQSLQAVVADDSRRD